MYLHRKRKTDNDDKNNSTDEVLQGSMDVFALIYKLCGLSIFLKETYY